MIPKRKRTIAAIIRKTKKPEMFRTVNIPRIDSTHKRKITPSINLIGEGNMLIAQSIRTKINKSQRLTVWPFIINSTIFGRVNPGICI